MGRVDDLLVFERHFRNDRSDFVCKSHWMFYLSPVVRPNEKRHLRLRPDYSRGPRSPRRRRQVHVVLGRAQAPDPQNETCPQ